MPRRDEVDPATALMSEQGFANWLRRRVDERDPAAVVRFGPGEARLLLTGPDDGESTKAVVRHLEEETDRLFSPGAVRQVRALVELAYDEADVLGMRFPERSRDTRKMWLGRLVADYSRRVEAGRPPAALAHCMLHDDIVDTLPGLLAGRRVSVVSCRDLEPVLESEWGLEDVAVYQVPSQHAVRDVDGAYEAAMHDVPIWPDAHARLHAELTVRERGEVFLVGAGLFGKDLCIRIRERGGIALDMGSVLDSIAGRVTRGPERRVIDLHARGMSMDEVDAHMQRIYGGVAGREEISGRVAAIFGQLLDDVAAWRARPLQEACSELRFDTLRAEVGEGQTARSRACHLAIGVTPGGHRDPVGLWWQDGEGAELWCAILGDLRRRGVREVGSIRAGGPAGLSEAIEAVFPGTPVRTAADPIESCAGVRGAIESHGRFADEQAAGALIHLALRRAEADWRGSG